MQIFEEAQEAQKSGRYKEAEDIYRKIISTDPRNFDALHMLGIVCFENGKISEADTFFRTALSIDSTYPPLVRHYGLFFARQRQYHASLEQFDKALKLFDKFAPVYTDRGISLMELGRLDEALSSHNIAATLAPNIPIVFYNRGNTLYKQRQFDDALRDYDKAIALHPKYSDAYCGRGNVLYNLKRYDDAFSAYDKALALKPDLEFAWLGRGNVLWSLKQYDGAIAAYDKSLSINPGLADAWLGRGNVFYDLKRYDDAVAAYDSALSLKPDLADAWLGRGNVFWSLKRHDGAIAAYDKSLSINPGLADAWLGRGNVFADLKRYDEAFAAYDKALALKHDLAEAHFNEAHARLSLGELTKGWTKYEYRWQLKRAVGGKRNFQQPLWLGDSEIRNKTILVHAEQGFGDTLLNCRYIPIIAQLGARVVAEVQPPLKLLLQNLEGVSMLIAQGETIPYFDVYCPIMSLPLAFKTTMQTIPDRTPYVAVSKDLVEKWRHKLVGDEIKVGIGWAGNADFGQDLHRSILLKNLLPALSVKGVRYFSLQKTHRHGDKQLLDANPQIMRLEQEIHDFQDTAAIMMSLDLVLSSDTSIVNLAGALGRPFWVLLHDTPDWRWLDSGKDTPWYPTGRLFRQTAAGDWTTVTDEVRAELDKLVASR